MVVALRMVGEVSPQLETLYFDGTYPMHQAMLDYLKVARRTATAPDGELSPSDPDELYLQEKSNTSVLVGLNQGDELAGRQ